MNNREALAYLTTLTAELESKLGQPSLKISAGDDEYDLAIDDDDDNTMIIIPPDNAEFKVHYKVAPSGIRASVVSGGVRYDIRVKENGMLDFGGDRPPHPEILSSMITIIDQHLAELSAEAITIQRMMESVTTSFEAVPTLGNDPGEDRARQRNADLHAIPELTENIGEEQALQRARVLRNCLADIDRVKSILKEYSEHQAHLALVNNGLLPKYENVDLTELATMSFSKKDLLNIEKEYLVMGWGTNKSRKLLVSKDVTEPTVLLFQSALDAGEKPTGGAAMLPHNFDAVVVPHEDHFHFKLGQAMFGNIIDDDSALILKPMKDIRKKTGDIIIKDESRQQQHRTERARQQLELLAPILDQAVQRLSIATGLSPDEVLNRLDRVELSVEQKSSHEYLNDLDL